MIETMIDFDTLIKKAAPDDPRISEGLVQAHYAYIYRLALSILGDADEADDAAQETFIRAVSNLRHYQPGTNLRGWLTTIAVNLCRDHLRRRKTRLALQGVLQMASRLTAHTPNPEEETVARERDDRLWQAVNQLDEKHRLPVLLRFVNDMSVREIADALQVQEGTIHSRLHYAIRKLQGRLGGLDPAEWGQTGQSASQPRGKGGRR